MIDDNLQIDLQVEKVKQSNQSASQLNQPQQYLELKNLSRSQQLSYTSRLFTILKDASNSPNASKWKEVQQLRLDYNLDPKNKDSLRRGILLNELVEADCLLDPTCFAPKDIKDTNKSNITYIDSETGITKQAPIGTRKMEVKFDSKLGDYVQSSEGVFPMTEEQSVYPEEIMKMHGYDPEKFNLLKSRTSVWQQGNKKNNIKTLYATKIEVAPKKEEEKPIDYKELFKEVIEDANYKIGIDRALNTMDNAINSQKIPEIKASDKTLLIMLSDCHLGRNSTISETGTYQTLQSSITALYENIDKYFEKFKNYGIKKIILPFGNDYLNSSFTGNTTSQLHKQDNSTTTQEIYRQAASAMIVIINKLSHIAPIHVCLTPGNHSSDEEMCLILMFEAYFRNNPNITFDTSTTTRKYIKQDNVLICLSHGYSDKKAIQNIAMKEAKEDFGKAKNVYWFLGHEHHFSAEEMPHQEIYRVPSMTENDKWTDGQGYSSKARSMAFVFNEDELIETHFMSI